MKFEEFPKSLYSAGARDRREAADPAEEAQLRADGYSDYAEALQTQPAEEPAAAPEPAAEPVNPTPAPAPKPKKGSKKGQ